MFPRINAGALAGYLDVASKIAKQPCGRLAIAAAKLNR